MIKLTLNRLKACRHFTAKGIRTNVTLCFSANRALLAAKAGATYVSPFIGRLDELNIDGMELIRDIRQIFHNCDCQTQILAVSIRSGNHVSEEILAGADGSTIPAAVIKGLASHALTDKGWTSSQGIGPPLASRFCDQRAPGSLSWVLARRRPVMRARCVHR